MTYFKVTCVHCHKTANLPTKLDNSLDTKGWHQEDGHVYYVWVCPTCWEQS